MFFAALISQAELPLARLLDIASKRYGKHGDSVVRQWAAALASAETVEEKQQLLIVNDFFNQRVRFSTDLAIWDQKDYWATPLETLGTAQGDCEDFSIGKYISLLNLGMSPTKLRLVYVKATLAGGRPQAHMVLAYYEAPNSDPLILDNLSQDILPASRRPDLLPVYSFNSEGLWVGGASSPSGHTPTARLSRWRDVLLRMQQEGLSEY